MMNIFIQARMSSTRFPGKMLAPLHGVPVIKHIVDRVSKVPDIQDAVVLTSTQQSDDPLAAYLDAQGHKVFRGDLDNVFLRFQDALKTYPCDAFVRICGDSPIIHPDLIVYMMSCFKKETADFLSNTHHKKFPKGQSVEIIKSDLFTSIDPRSLTEEQQEHVMPYFYENAAKYKTVFPDSTVNHRHINTCVDTIEDLQNLETGEIDYNFDESTICLND